ncbi:MAG: hypothetical protein ACLQU3_16495 [Limisphaerales bacterium]
MADHDLQFATERESSPQAVGGKTKRQTGRNTHEQELHDPPRLWASAIHYSRVINRSLASFSASTQMESAMSVHPQTRPTPQITKAAAPVKRVAGGGVAGVNGRTGFAASPAFSTPGSRHCGVEALSPRLNHCNRRNRDNCSSSVIRFLSRPNAAATKTHKNPSFSTFTAARRPETKGNIAPFKPFTFQEKLETQAVFAISRSAATEKTGQTKDIRYPVFIRNRRPCYQNN